jgi:hypothetical protein
MSQDDYTPDSVKKRNAGPWVNVKKTG